MTLSVAQFFRGFAFPLRYVRFPSARDGDSESVCVKMCALSRSGNFVFNDLLHTSAVAVLFKFERSNLQQRATQNTQRTKNVRVAVFSETENRSTTKKILKQHILKIPQHFGYKLQKILLNFNSDSFFINLSGLVSCARVCVRCV